MRVFCTLNSLSANDWLIIKDADHIRVMFRSCRLLFLFTMHFQPVLDGCIMEQGILTDQNDLPEK